MQKREQKNPFCQRRKAVASRHTAYPVCKKGIRNYATDSDGNITLYVADTDDYELKYKTYITWLRSQCLPLMTLLCKRAYDEHYGKLGIDFPTIKVKDMRSRWGSCIPSKKILTFNVHLMEYPLPAAEYVVAHEFTHFCRQTTVQGSTQSLQGICLITSRGKGCLNKLKQKQQEITPAVRLSIN